MRKWQMAAACAVASCVLLVGASMASAVTIETVPVGDVGNAGYTTGYGQVIGQVNYAYNIGKYEVTAGQFTGFLNAVGGVEGVDTYALYNTGMSDTSQGSGITRSGGGTVGNPYTYTVAASFVNRPVNYVSFWDSCRFANWLQNGQPTGTQGAGTTETGAYTMTSGTIIRNAGTTWAVTSDAEWYKAAYYKGGGINAGYWLYPTKSDAAPGWDMADASGNNANNYSDSGYPIDSGKYTTVVGQFQNSASPYGTFDQGGNVSEWSDDDHGSYRLLQGGSFDSQSDMTAWGRYDDDPRIELSIVGFRVSQVPEPALLGVLSLSVIAMLARRRDAGR